jgi:hypothetical protein
MVFDITGGVLTTIGVLFAGVTSTVKRRKILGTFHREIARGRSILQAELSEKLHTYVVSIKVKIDANFEDFDEMLAKEEVQIAKLEEKQRSIGRRLEGVEREVSQV